MADNRDSEPASTASPYALNEADYFKTRTGYFDALDKMLWIQALLLTGFAFVGLATLSYPPDAPRALISAFAVSASLTAALELLAMFVAGLLACLPKKPIIQDRYMKFGTVAFFSHYGGMAAFLCSVVLVCWIKYRPAALAVSVLVALVASGIVLCLYRMAMTAEQIEKERIEAEGQSSSRRE